ncbi:biotin carboxylase [Leptolyngbya sp. 'hensonii']|uniref:ATP-binding protein n=1 Tax=Leptolyngbya sp. 'hensonii' TaxID=1922337 RepID=UPI00095000AC|nr:ATP-binding protein [Leptolyngbya sp. 'hensonii']OLP19692.1 biotin carboxylase [Leptolyngbya sp. 'hensonii']
MTSSAKIPKRISTALINALSAGVVPRVGLEHIAVGREQEIKVLLQDLHNTAEGGAAFRFVVGRYGAGKSFTLQLLRNHAMEQGFVVADADLSPERRLAGSGGSSVATYRALMQNLSTKIRPDGGALAPILERWIAGIQTQVAQESGKRPNDAGFDDLVETRIREVVKQMEELVNGFEFANVIIAYWSGYRADDEPRKDAALRWLRGEFATKTEAKAALGVRVIIDDESWYDYLKLLARFVAGIGYKGLLVLLDEAVHLYKITTSASRQNNYDKLLMMFNDAMQGRVGHLGILIGGTPQFVEDPRRGLYSDPAWQRRTTKSQFVKIAVQDLSGPVIRLEPLSQDEILQLLQRLAEIHTTHYGYKGGLKAQDYQDFLQEVVKRLGAEALLTPGEIVRDFISVLTVLQQNPKLTLNKVLGGAGFQPTQAGKDPKGDERNEFAEFTV